MPTADIPALQDFIYWQPDATGTGVEPIYVMLSDPLDSGKYTRRQLQRKYKHAIDFGISDAKINSETLTKFRDAIDANLADKDTFEKGTYRRDKGSKVYFNPKTMNAVIIRANGDFLSGWKIDQNEDNDKIYLNLFRRAHRNCKLTPSYWQTDRQYSVTQLGWRAGSN